jgi:hypothetical protein
MTGTLSIPAGALASSDPLRRGLVGWYRMLGNADDSSGKGNAGTLVNAPTAAADKYGNASSAYAFNGTNQYITLAQTSGLPVYSDTTPWSIAMWVNGGSQSTKYIFMEGNSAGGLPLVSLVTSSAKLQALFRTASSTTLSKISTGTVFDSTWHHVVFTDNAGAAKLYIDGTQDATDFTYTPAAISLNRSTIGAARSSGVSSYFTGSIFGVRLYNRALSAGEARTLYAATQRI